MGFGTPDFGQDSCEIKRERQEYNKPEQAIEIHNN